MNTTIIAIATSACALVGCSLPGQGANLPGPAPKAPCPAGEVTVSVAEATPCDLVAGVNTLTITDISPAMAADYGCVYDGDDAGVDCDF